MKHLQLITPDRQGLTVEITEKLAAKHINILNLKAHTIDGNAIIELVADQPEEAMHSLLEQGYQVVSDDLITVRLNDQPGALAQITRNLNDAGLSIRGISTLQRQQGHCYVALSTNDDIQARQLLSSVLL